MPTVNEVQEERHNLRLCACAFESLYTANFTHFSPVDRIATHFIYIYIYIYNSRLVIIGMSHTKNQ